MPESKPTDAMRALREAIPRANADPARPAYHFVPPAQWMNDINGTIFHKGQYHVFYQHNPFGDMPTGEKLAHMHWGHARSSDLVNWEHLPIALAPSLETGEKSCWSGCAAIDGSGDPIIIYTSVSEDQMPFTKPFTQAAALGDERLLSWRKYGRNPILSIEKHGPPRSSGEWRDPFVFKTGAGTFLILGACGDAGIPLFQARDETLLNWKHVGSLAPENVECPNFFELGRKWILISSPFDLVKYAAGTFDLESLEFSPQAVGIVDWGACYGTNVLTDDMGRRILFGWIPGWNWELFQIGRGWNGCMALPRVLTLDAKHRILQEPAAELKKLRVHESLVEKTKVALDDSQSPLRAQIDFQSEVLAELSAITAAECGLRFFSGENVIDIKCHPQRLLIEVADTPVPLPSGEQSRLSLHVFIDRSVVEIYINDGEVVVSKMFNTALTNPRLEVYARDGSMKIDSLRVWRLNAAERKFAYPELDNI
ncbi:MAG: hypothetical protein C4520_09615 [Candidatus Abyssobacteria bacterium SURF_5]|uniref:beta-fructofuranosidase n=1 Tax=Abyssobacteria bacterium (strain SURF_5) TaxID=2093360 RepID=A0A3A4NM24_ABYX5|nr:MAG: hypothetical protein C4520_09615 [Candidatus Abyssubacteria bacterium SURF_5]